MAAQLRNSDMVSYCVPEGMRLNPEISIHNEYIAAMVFRSYLNLKFPLCDPILPCDVGSCSL